MLFLILALGFGLRILGLPYGLPDLFHADEPILMNAALLLPLNQGDPKFYIIPSWSIYMAAIGPCLEVLMHMGSGRWDSMEAYGKYILENPSMIYILGRFFGGVLPGVLSILIFFDAIKKQINTECALWASFFLSISHIHVQHSHYLYADIWLTFWFLAAYNALIRFHFSRKMLWMYVTAILVGCGVATKYSFVYISPFFIICLFQLNRSKKTLQVWQELVISVFISIATFIALNPYAFVRFSEYVKQVHQQSHAEWYVGWLHHLHYSLGGGIGYMVLTLAVMGILGICLRGDVILRAMVATSMLFYVIQVYFSQEFARYMLLMVPFIYLYASLGLMRLIQHFSIKIKIMIALLLALTLLQAPVYSSYLFMQSDTRTLAKEWIEKNISEEERIAIASLSQSPRLWKKPAQIQEIIELMDNQNASQQKIMRWRWLEEIAQNQQSYEWYSLLWENETGENRKFYSLYPTVSRDLASLNAKQINWIILNNQEKQTQMQAFKEIIQPTFKKVHAFSPYRSPLKTHSVDKYDSTAGPHLPKELFSRERLGPYIEIYQRNR